MSWINFTRALRGRVSPPAASGEANIDEELLFHFRSLVDENLAKGLPADAAWHDAQRRFGSLGRYADECRQVVMGGFPMLHKISVAGFVVLALVVAWLFSEVRSLRQAAAAAPAEKTAAAKAAKSQKADLAGIVVDSAGKPIPDAHVLVILKTWPGNRYRQEDFAGKTDEKGRFRFAELVPAKGQRAVHMAVVKDGYALTTTYDLKKQGEAMQTDGLKFTLDAATKVTIAVRDAAGRPAGKAGVLPSGRQTADGQDHVVYFQAAKPIEMVADGDGRIQLAMFKRGDQAKIYVRLAGRDWEEHGVTIPDQGDMVEITADAPNAATE
ncbi:MAG TPA: carboxypeptidase-like regulatory domain-containing protein [Pirellulales bacterium]|nr:carboxypeptidase-like regulatory domain-containing protein [Pirellulales bacterium]